MHKKRNSEIYRPLGYERVYFPRPEVADTPFHIQGDDMQTVHFSFLLCIAKMNPDQRPCNRRSPIHYY